MRKLITLGLLTFLAVSSFGQPATVNFDMERSYFNENQPLPVEKQLLVKGAIGQDIQVVEINIFTSKGKEDRSPLFTALWKKSEYKTNNTFELPINYKLRSSSEYDIRISYYRPISQLERAELKKKMYGNLDNFINMTFAPSKNKIKFTKSSKHIKDDLDQVVNRGLMYFRNMSSVEFDGFSEMILEKINLIEGTKLSKGKNLTTETDKKEIKISYRSKLINELKVLIHGELEQLLNTRWAMLKDARFVNDYPTEKTLSIISINGGYGGVIFTAKDSLSFGGSPYFGVSFPLGKKAMASPFFSNTSINVGVFINNFKDASSGVELTGPIFKRPYYVGLGYKAFQFIRFNAGVTLLEDIGTAGLDLGGIRDRVTVRPFVGVSAEFNIWSAFAK